MAVCTAAASVHTPESPSGKMVFCKAYPALVCDAAGKVQPACFPQPQCSESPSWEAETSPALQALPTWLRNMRDLQMNTDILWINGMEKASILEKHTKDVRETKRIFLQVPEVMTRRGDRNPNVFILPFTQWLRGSPKNYQILFLFISLLWHCTLPQFVFCFWLWNTFRSNDGREPCLNRCQAQKSPTFLSYKP